MAFVTFVGGLCLGTVLGLLLAYYVVKDTSSERES
jgi:hypothetical protein